MQVNYRNENIVEAELVNGKEIITVICPNCGKRLQLEETDIINPYAYTICPHCENAIFLS